MSLIHIKYNITVALPRRGGWMLKGSQSSTLKFVENLKSNLIAAAHLQPISQILHFARAIWSVYNLTSICLSLDGNEVILFFNQVNFIPCYLFSYPDKFLTHFPLSCVDNCKVIIRAQLGRQILDSESPICLSRVLDFPSPDTTGRAVFGDSCGIWNFNNCSGNAARNTVGWYIARWIFFLIFVLTVAGTFRDCIIIKQAYDIWLRVFFSQRSEVAPVNNESARSRPGLINQSVPVIHSPVWAGVPASERATDTPEIAPLVIVLFMCLYIYLWGACVGRTVLAVFAGNRPRNYTRTPREVADVYATHTCIIYNIPKLMR